MVSTVEAQMRQAQTQALIDAEGISLSLTRQPWVSDGAGGWRRGARTSVAAQKVRLISANTQLPVRRTMDGREVSPLYTMVGMPDLNVQAGDSFIIDSVRYEVVFVQPSRVDATRAEVAYGR